MQRLNWKLALAGLFAAQTTVAMAPRVAETIPVAQFVNDQGQLITVDPPAADRQPVFVAIPLTPEKAPARQAKANGASGR
jgi:hypothetical protein